MSSKRYDGQNFVDTNTQKRYDGSNWIDVSSSKRFDGSNWIETLATPVNISYDTFSSNVSRCTITKTSYNTINWSAYLINSSNYTYIYFSLEGITLNKGDVVTFKCSSTITSSSKTGITATIQSKGSDSNAVTIGSTLQDYTFVAPSYGYPPCFKVTRNYNASAYPSGTIVCDYVKINGKMYKPTFIER